MIGPLEIVLLVLIVLLVTGLYKKLPALGRSAGTQARVGGEKARELADRTAPKAKKLASKASARGSEVGDRIDAGEIGRKAGKGAREIRDARASLTGMLDPPPKRPPDERGDGAERDAGSQRDAGSRPGAGSERDAEATDAERRPGRDAG